MPSSAVQKSLETQFMAVTGAPLKSATRFLKASGWKLDQACDSYFASNPTAPTFKATENLAKLFEQYRNAAQDEDDIINVDGEMKYLVDLGVNLDSAEVLVPLEIVQAPAMGEMGKDGFIDGWKTLGADTITKQKAYVAGQIKQLSTDLALFKRVYRHTFISSKEKAQKALPLDNALVYWGLLFSPPGRPWATGSIDWCALWSEFLTAKWTKSVNKDMWNQTFEFYLRTMQDPTLSFWSEDAAWPGVIDDFVGYVKEKGGILPESMETD